MLRYCLWQLSKGEPYPNEQREQDAVASMDARKDIMLANRPSVRVRSLSSVYNCMGMVFANRRTWVDPEHLPMILEDDGYRLVANEQELQPGDVVVYRDADGEVSHVGIVTEVRTNPREASLEVFVMSQWGESGEYFHRANEVHPALGNPSEYWTDRTDKV